MPIAVEITTLGPLYDDDSDPIPHSMRYRKTVFGRPRMTTPGVIPRAKPVLIVTWDDFTPPAEPALIGPSEE